LPVRKPLPVAFATIIGYNLDGNKEMIAMGFSNIAGSLSSCYVATSGRLMPVNLLEKRNQNMWGSVSERRLQIPFLVPR
jgi:hypothetical protein